MGYAPLLGHTQELTLTFLFVPVVGSILGQKTLGACARVDLRLTALFLTTSAQIEAPHGEPDAPGLALGIVGSGEQPVGNFQLLDLILPQAYELHRPSIGGSEVADGLPWLFHLNGEFGGLTTQ